MAKHAHTLEEKFDLAVPRQLLTGTQAIVRLMLMQKARDKAANQLWTTMGGDYNAAVAGSAVVDSKTSPHTKHTCQSVTLLRSTFTSPGVHRPPR